MARTRGVPRDQGLVMNDALSTDIAVAARLSSDGVLHALRDSIIAVALVVVGVQASISDLIPYVVEGVGHTRICRIHWNQ